MEPINIATELQVSKNDWIQVENKESLGWLQSSLIHSVMALRVSTRCQGRLLEWVVLGLSLFFFF